MKLNKQTSEAETRCSCLPKAQVEDNLINGVNPLGLEGNQCYQVPAEIINNLHGPNGIKQIENKLL